MQIVADEFYVHELPVLEPIQKDFTAILVFCV